MFEEDTIAAISTPPGVGGISVIRISGIDAVQIADRVFYSKSGKGLLNAKSHTITHGFVKSSEGNIIDEVLVSVMLSPKTYTRENVVEINCHGGLVSTKAVLDAVLCAGARLADAGEFTKRAFLNGRMDLCEAESVIDIINSKSYAQHTMGVNQLRGHLSQKINQIRESLLTLTAHLQVLIDFADEDLEPLSDEEFTDGLKNAQKEIESLLASSVAGRVLKEGVKTAIVGKPNVGKSSLLNLLCGEERAIVTDIEGTTRDTIEESVSLNNVMLKITDTAGIRKTGDVIESIGVEKSKSEMAEAELVIFVADATKPLDENDKFIIQSLSGKKAVALINKCDCEIVTDAEYIKQRIKNTVMFSTKEGKGVDELGDIVAQMFEVGDITPDSSVMITNVRHKDALQKAKEALGSALQSIECGIPANMTYIDIENAISALGEITGQTVAEEITDKIFHSFCVGK